MSADPREFEYPIDGTTLNELPTVLGVGSLTPEAIEAAARTLWEVGSSANPIPWDEVGDWQLDQYRMFATAALTAAAPIIAAQAKGEALKEAADAVEGECAADASECFCGSSDWLRARADTIEGVTS